MDETAKKIIRKFVVKPWPGGGFVFPLDKEVDFFGAYYLKGLRGHGGIGGMCWTETMEDALDIISKYPNNVKIEISIRALIDLLREEQDEEGSQEH
jgi:hypothetical protein